jgi:hypothetical protein
MAYDEARRRVVLVGSGAVGPQVSTCEWDGSRWTTRATAQAPPLRLDPRLAYDTTREKLVLFGGASVAYFSDTWEYGPVHAATHAPFGNGCPGSAGTPSLAIAGGARPWLGDTITLELTSVPQTTAALLLVGTSRAAWGPVPLPLDLSPLGMPGCALRVNGTGILAVAVGGGRGAVPLRIPDDASLLGSRFYDQAIVVDPAANAAGATASHALEARIGGR